MLKFPPLPQSLSLHLYLPLALSSPLLFLPSLAVPPSSSTSQLHFSRISLFTSSVQLVTSEVQESITIPLAAATVLTPLVPHPRLLFQPG